jgi:predicted nucleic acid-binding protein
MVLDASAAVLAVVADGAARDRVARQPLHVPHLVDTEVTSALRAGVATGKLDATDAERALAVWLSLAVERHASVRLLPRVWELRHHVTVADAMYVALAERLDCPLLTADARLVAASGPRCAFLTVRS